MNFSLYSLRSLRSILTYTSIVLVSVLIYKWKMEFVVSSIGISILFIIVGVPVLWYFLSTMHTLVFEEATLVVKNEIPFYKPIEFRTKNIKEMGIVSSAARLNKLRVVMDDHTVKLFVVDSLSDKKIGHLARLLNKYRISHRLSV
ncbi:MAG: hypothetical protein OCC49_11980 [Fibrobacterales bacterium]